MDGLEEWAMRGTRAWQKEHGGPEGLYQRTWILTHFMAAKWPARVGAVRRAMWGIGQAPQRTRQAVLPHRRPRSLARSRRCSPLAVAPHRGAGRA